MRSLGKILLAFALLHLVLQGQAYLLLQVFLTSYFAFQSSMMKRISFGVLVLEGLVSHHRMVQLQFLHLSDWGIDLDYCDIRIGSANYERYFWPK